MAANQQLLEAITVLIEQTGHSPNDILETAVVLAGCTMQACEIERITVMNHDDTQSFTLVNNRKV